MGAFFKEIFSTVLFKQVNHYVGIVVFVTNFFIGHHAYLLVSYHWARITSTSKHAYQIGLQHTLWVTDKKEHMAMLKWTIYFPKEMIITLASR